MGTKLEWASAVALAASVVTAVLSTQGSGAAATDSQPVPIAQQEPSQEAAEVSAPSTSTSEAKAESQATVHDGVAFVARPVVQALPGAQEDAPSEMPAETLAQLVAAQASPRRLDKQLRCLAGAIYFEARGETLQGQLAVGRVVINRVNSGLFPDSNCGVVLQAGQFSFVRRGHLPHIPEKSAAWKRAVAIALIAMDNNWENPARGALYFHAARISPRWSHARLAQVDNHIFYR